MATIITDLKETFRRGNIYIQLIYINVAVFILTTKSCSSCSTGA